MKIWACTHILWGFFWGGGGAEGEGEQLPAPPLNNEVRCQIDHPDGKYFNLIDLSFDVNLCCVIGK